MKSAINNQERDFASAGNAVSANSGACSPTDPGFSGGITDGLEDLARELMEIHLAYSKQVSQLAEYLNASGEYAILYYLYHNESTCSAGELALVVGLTPGRVANVMKALEKKELITRVKDPEDHRKIKVSLTEHGLAYMSNGCREVEKVYKTMISQIGIEDARDFIRIARKMFQFSRDFSEGCNYLKSPEES